MYEKEATQIEEKIEKLKTEGADEYVLKKQVSVDTCVLYLPFPNVIGLPFIPLKNKNKNL
jgi:hypothetical protein